MEGMGIWIFLLLFYLLQALTKRKQKQQRQQQAEEIDPKPKAPRDTGSRRRQPSDKAPQKPQRPVSLEDLFNPEKLRDILGVPQTESAKAPQPVETKMVKPEIRKRWEEPKQSKPALHSEQEMRETLSKVASPDITDVDESASQFKAQRMAKADITSDHFDKRKTAPGEKEESYTLDYFDEPVDIRNAVILKEILDRPRAYRRNIR